MCDSTLCVYVYVKLRVCDVSEFNSLKSTQIWKKQTRLMELGATGGKKGANNGRRVMKQATVEAAEQAAAAAQQYQPSQSRHLIALHCR